MKQRPRIYYSDAQKALMWKRWRQGATLHEIAKLFDRFHSSVHRIFSETGHRLTSGAFCPPFLATLAAARRVCNPGRCYRLA